MAAGRFGNSCCAPAPSTRSSASRTIAGSSRFIAASVSCCSPHRAARRRAPSPAGWANGIRHLSRPSATNRQTPPPGFRVRLTPALLERLSGDGLTIPDIRAPIDLSIVERAASLFPPLGSDAGWRARFGRELNATDDRAHFTSPAAGLPVVAGKQIEPFRVDVAAARFGITARNAARLLDPARFERPRLAYRDVASATNRLTLIAAILPPRCVSTHTVFCLRTPLSLVDQYFLCGLFNSFIVNYLVRLRVNTHVTTAVVEGLPIPGRQAGPGACRELAALARLIARGADQTACGAAAGAGGAAVSADRARVRTRAGNVPADSGGGTRGARCGCIGRHNDEDRRHRDDGRHGDDGATETQRLMRSLNGSSAVRSRFIASWVRVCWNRSTRPRCVSRWMRPAWATRGRHDCPPTTRADFWDITESISSWKIGARRDQERRANAPALRRAASDLSAGHG